MKRLSFLILLFISVHAMGQINPVSINIIPAPTKLKLSDGFYPLSSKTSIGFTGFSRQPEHLRQFAAGILKAPVFADSKIGTSQGKGISLVLDKTSDLPDEGYRLNVTSSGITILSKTESGVLYGLQTLIQLIPDSLEKGSVQIPFVQIEDFPRFKYRGLHLDVGRHMFPVSFIKTYIDLISAYKLNTFHWHLTEDQGWRIEIKKYPKLTSIGGYRDQTLIGQLRKTPHQFNVSKYGGYYTQEEIKDVVNYASSRYITVVPEIEMPGHALAALSAYPELACGHNPGPFKAADKWGVFEDVFCAGKEQTYDFLEDVLDEVLTLFPSKYIHIGGDESPKARWKECEFCQKKIKKHNLKDEHELQSFFIQRMEKYLNKKGRKIIGWDEILEGGLAPNATVMSWRGIKGGVAAAQQNHDVIMTPSTHLYIDYAESKSVEEPLTIGGPRHLEKVYSYDPVPASLTPEQRKYIIGVQANMWTEYLTSPEKVNYMLFPRVFALSEIAWSDLANKDWTRFSEQTLPVHLAKLDKEKTMYRVPSALGAKDTTLTGSRFMLDYKVPVAGGRIYYTINGYTPYEFDSEYKAPITIDVPAGEERILKSVVVAPSSRRSVVVTTVLRNPEKSSSK